MIRLFEEIHPIVINLKSRKDRLNDIVKEFNYIGVDNYNIFEGIDTGDYKGCALSHLKIAENFLRSKDEYVFVMEDDSIFLPWYADIIEEIRTRSATFQIDIINLGPSVHCPLSTFDDFFVNLNNRPPKTNDMQRGVFGTGCLVYNRKVAKLLLNFDLKFQVAIDQFLDYKVYGEVTSLAPKYPLAVQRNGFSDVNGTEDTPFYTAMYNWNQYGNKLPNTNWSSQEYVEKIRVNRSTINIP